MPDGNIAATFVRKTSVRGIVRSSIKQHPNGASVFLVN